MKYTFGFLLFLCLVSCVVSKVGSDQMQNSYTDIPNSELEFALPARYKLEKKEFVNREKQAALFLFVIKSDSIHDFVPSDRSELMVKNGYKVHDVKEFEINDIKHFAHFVSICYLGNVRTYELFSSIAFENYFIKLSCKLKKENYEDIVNDIIASIQTIRVKSS